MVNQSIKEQVACQFTDSTAQKHKLLNFKNKSKDNNNYKTSIIGLINQITKYGKGSKVKGNNPLANYKGFNNKKVNSTYNLPTGKERAMQMYIFVNPNYSIDKKLGNIKPVSLSSKSDWSKVFKRLINHR